MFLKIMHVLLETYMHCICICTYIRMPIFMYAFIYMYVCIYAFASDAPASDEHWSCGRARRGRGFVRA